MQRTAKARLLQTSLNNLKEVAIAFDAALVRDMTGDPDTDPTAAACLEDMDKIIKDYARLRNEWAEMDGLDVDIMDVSFDDNDWIEEDEN